MYQPQRNKNFLPKKDLLNINSSIQAPSIRLIGVDGEPIGVVTLEDGLAQAKALELDLVEIAPLAHPPVCKIMSYGKYLYQKSKESRLHKAKQKKSELKMMRISFKIDTHDMQTKAKQIVKFLEEGDKVRVDLVLRGREKAFFPLAQEKMEYFITILPEYTFLEQPIKKTPQGYSVTLAKK